MGVKLLHALEIKQEATENSGKLENDFNIINYDFQKHFTSKTFPKNNLFHNLTLHIVPCLGKFMPLHTL